MSNVFDQELHQALKAAFIELEDKELIQQNLEKAAKIGLYYAHGMTEKASNKLETDQKDLRTTDDLLKEATELAATSAHIITAATAAGKDAQNTRSAVSTAAVNMQAAANALTNLSADVAAIWAVATSKDYGSKIRELANWSNNLTRQAAEKADAVVLQSLNTTAEAAQSKAGEMLTQAKTLQKDVETLTGALVQHVDALRTKVGDDRQSLSTAIAQEKEQQGIYQTALQEERAMQSSARFMTAASNYDLSYVKVGSLGDQFKVGFNRFAEDQDLPQDRKPKKERVLEEYRIIFTELDDAASFDVHAAKTTTHYTSVPPHTVKAAKIKTDSAVLTKVFDYELSFATGDFSSTGSDPQPSQAESIKAVDFRGHAISRGIPYAIFVYAIYTCEYQDEMNDTDGLLSLPSLPFTLLTDLPRAHTPSLEFYIPTTDKGSQISTANAMRVRFSVDERLFNGVDLRDLTDFRVMLFKEMKPFFLDTDILEQIPASYSLQAVPLKETDEPNTSGSGRAYVAVNTSGDFTDNYGEPLIHGERYQALVLSVVQSSEPSAYSLYQPVYSEFSTAVVFDPEQ